MTMRRVFLSLVLAVVCAAACSSPEVREFSSNPDRNLWVTTMDRVCRPVLTNLAAGTLKQNMPVESVDPEGKENCTYLEALGRVMVGISPWLELGADDFVSKGVDYAVLLVLIRKALERSERLLGADGINKLKNASAAVFGVGGVGSWCAESLVRSGIRHLTIVDSDRVCVTNCNRQLMATSATVGQSKVEALKRHLLEINPNAEITALHRRYTGEPLEGELAADYVIDAIDSLDCKLALITQATSSADITFFSSMGAAMKTDPTRIKTAEFWKVQGCPLARALRNKIRKSKEFPKKKFQCVFSDEEPTGNMGSIVQVTAVFGFTLCSLVINDIKNKVQA